MIEEIIKKFRSKVPGVTPVEIRKLPGNKDGYLIYAPYEGNMDQSSAYIFIPSKSAVTMIFPNQDIDTYHKLVASSKLLWSKMR